MDSWITQPLFTFRATHQFKGAATAATIIITTILSPYPMAPKIPSRKADAAFVMLVRERDLHSARQVVREIEDRFNRNYEYPYVFLNEVPFTKNFERTMRTVSKAQMTFGTIPKEHWSYPSWISQDQANKTRRRMRKIIYGWSESYRHMCR